MKKGLRLISEALPNATQSVFHKKYVMLGRLLTRWEDIVGKEFYEKTQPVKIRYYKSKKKQGDNSISLDIATTSADATILHYQKDLILERINQIFGAGWITAIRFVPATSTENKKSRKTNYDKRSSRKVLLEQDKEALDSILSGIEDEEIKKRLEKLGTAILQKPSSPL